MPKFHVFLSHNSVDKPWVIKLKDDLLCYGVSVWLDKDEIRPGDLFAKALEQGLADSRAVALVVSPEAMASGWVEAEYYRALALAQNRKSSVQLIPVILRDAELPGFLGDRHWVDFRDETSYAQNVWGLVWGITGEKPSQVLDLTSPDVASTASLEFPKQTEAVTAGTTASTRIPGKSQRASGVPPDLYDRMQTALLDCGPFDRDDDIRAVFIDTRLSPWRKRLPQTNNPDARVQAVVEFLYDRHSHKGDNALVSLLRVLSERTDPGDACHRRLAELADELERELKHYETTESTDSSQDTQSGEDKDRIPLESPHGTMPPNSRFYIERAADGVAWGYLSQGQAVTVYVQAPRQVGKSSLMRRITYRAKQAYGIDTAFIDFEKFTEAQLEDEEEFLVEFCCMMGDALGVPEAIDEYWSSRRRSTIVKCSNYVSQHIIPSFGKPFILAMDEVERLLDKPFCNDVFGMLRTWHNDRAWDTSFAQVTLFLSSSTEPHLFIDNPNQSPFNVTEPIALHDFTQAEVEELNHRHGEPLKLSHIGDLVKLLGGHPFLTRLALYLLATQRMDFKTLLETAASDTGPFADHLRRYWQHILDMPEVKKALSQICHNQVYPEDKLYYRLKGAGLVKTEDSQVVMRNQLYERYFKERLCG